MFTTRSTPGTPSIGCSRGSPSSTTSVVGVCVTRILGGALSSVWLSARALETTPSVASSSSSENVTFASDSCRLIASANGPSWSAEASGSFTCRTSSDWIVTVRASRSVDTRAVNQAAPNCGSASPGRCSDTAARADSRSPSSDSGCGW